MQYKTKHRDYINSDEWKLRKKLYYKNNKRACVVCGQTKRVQLHHKHYRTLCNEEDYDLVPLCEKHHNQLHKEYNQQKKCKLESFTDKFIKKNKKRLQKKTKNKIKNNTGKRMGNKKLNRYELEYRESKLLAIEEWDEFVNA